MSGSEKDFPDWEALYKNQKVETMPWYNENFDFDLEKELDRRGIINGSKKFLDLGTGPATQAIWLAKRGFKVTGSDLSEAAISRARRIYANEKNVNFIVDDILNSKFNENEFDYIFDRGCIHVLSPANRPNYIRKIKRILKANGILFLKCFSNKEPRLEGPYKFSQDEIRDLFNESFRIDNIKRNCLSRDFGSTSKGTICCYDKSGLKGNENTIINRKITIITTIRKNPSDLGYGDFSGWFIGHSGSTYWTKKDSEKAEIFRKVEPYITFLNIPQLERQGADIQNNLNPS